MSEAATGTPRAAAMDADALFKAKLTGQDPDPNAAGGILDFQPMPGAVKSANVVPPAAEPGDGDDASDGQPPAKAAPAPKAEGGDAPNGDASNQEGEDAPDQTVEKILAKYGTPEKLARGYLNLQRLQSAKADEAKDLEAHLLQVQRIAEATGQYFEERNGELVLRADVAGARLREARSAVDAKAIAAQVRQEWEANYRDKISEDGFDQFMAASEPQIKELTDRRVTEAKQSIRDQEALEYVEVGQTIGGIFQKNPKFNEVADEMDDWFEGIPDSVRRAVVKAKPDLLVRIGRAELVNKNLRPMLKEAFDLGLKAGKAPAEPGGPGSPSGAGRGKRTPGSEDRDASFKASLTGPGKFQTIDSLFKG